LNISIPPTIRANKAGSPCIAHNQSETPRVAKALHESQSG